MNDTPGSAIRGDASGKGPEVNAIRPLYPAFGSGSPLQGELF
jgi:hypothetical protein